jgi:hypothetical protein
MENGPFGHAPITERLSLARVGGAIEMHDETVEYVFGQVGPRATTSEDTAAAHREQRGLRTAADGAAR